MNPERGESATTRHTPLIVGIGGPSGTGKSTVAKRVANTLDARTISMESFYLRLSGLSPEERAAHNFDSPDAIDAKLLTRCVKDFSEGKDIYVPVYDFAEHTRVTGKFEHVKSGPILIVEGILVLNWSDLREIFDLSVYFDAPDEICFHRRLVRDIVERQRAREFAEHQYRETVLPMALQYVFPTKRFADVVIDANQPVEMVEAALTARIKARAAS